jgi:hypothetical protein
LLLALLTVSFLSFFLLIINFLNKTVIAPYTMMTAYRNNTSGIITRNTFVIINVDFHHETILFVDAYFFNCIIFQFLFNEETPYLKEFIFAQFVKLIGKE